MICSVALADNPYRSLHNFNAGELTPLLDAREDLAKYQNGASIMENVIPIPQGGAQKRPGTKYIAEVKTSSLTTRILPFEFSTSQSYIIEAGNQYMRFFTSGASVDDGAGTETTFSVGEYSVATATSGTSTFTISGSGDLSDEFVAGNKITVFGSSSNDELYLIGSTSYAAPVFSIVVSSPAMVDSTADGTIVAYVAHWKLNDNSDSQTVAEPTGVFTNSTVAQNTSVLHADGKVGSGSFDLDNQYSATVADHARLSFNGTADQKMSITAWINVENSTSIQTILSKWDETSGSELREWRFSMDDSEKLQFHLSDDSVSLTPIAHYLFNDNLATKVVLDNDGTTHNGATESANTSALSTTGKVGLGFDFGGADCVLIPDAAAFSFNGTADAAFTLTGWAYVTAHTGIQGLIAKWDGPAAKREWALWLNSSEQLELRLYDQSASAWIGEQSDSALTTGWHFLY